MIERAARAWWAHESDSDVAWSDVIEAVQNGYRARAEQVLHAAFEDVPITNYGIGLALQFFDLVICVKDRPMGAAAGVYRSNGDPDGFDGLSHSITVNYGHKPKRHIKSVTIGGLPAAGAEPDA